MAQTTKQIYDEIQAEKQTLSSLDDLQPSQDTYDQLRDDLSDPANVATHRLFEMVIAYLHSVKTHLYDAFKAFVDEKEKTMHYGTIPWWHKMVGAFQYGDTLQWNGDAYVYATEDEAKQIADRRAIIDEGGKVVIKVATTDQGNTVPFDNPQITALESYAKKIRPVGTPIQIISINADLLQLHADIYYNPLVMKADGSLIDDANTFPVEDAILNYLSDIPFNGILNLTELVDAMQGAEGVVDPVLDNVKARQSTAQAFSTVNVSYNPTSGWIEIDDQNPLSATVNYIPHV